MKQPSFMYEDVATVCIDISSKGSKPTVDLVRAKLGGSNSRVLSFLQDWNEAEKRKDEGSRLNCLSKDIQNLISREINTFAKTLESDVKKQTHEYKSQINEIKIVLEKEENANTEHEDTIKQFEKELAVKENEIKTIKSENLCTKKELLAEQKECEKYRIEIATIKGERDGLDYLKNENAQLKKEITLTKEKLSAKQGQLETLSNEHNKLLQIVKIKFNSAVKE